MANETAMDWSEQLSEQEKEEASARYSTSLVAGEIQLNSSNGQFYYVTK